jgi:hypothetical protein
MSTTRDNGQISPFPTSEGQSYFEYVQPPLVVIGLMFFEYLGKPAVLPVLPLITPLYIFASLINGENA